jgi:metal-responsive CopG/Arc/MetJ family transcriptional regulator
MKNITVSIPKRLIAVAEEIAKETKTNRSKVISQCLENLARSRKEELMIKYYETMAKEHDEFANKSIKIIQEIASTWSD